MKQSIIVLLLLVLYTGFASAQTAVYDGRDSENCGYECKGVDPFNLECTFWMKRVFYFWGGDTVQHRNIIETISQGHQILRFGITQAPIVFTLPFEKCTPGNICSGNRYAYLIVVDPEHFNREEFSAIIKQANLDYSIGNYPLEGYY